MKIHHPPHSCSRLGLREDTATAVWKSAPQRAPTVLPTGRFLAESKYKISKEEERPSLAWPLSARMSVSTCKGGEALSGCVSDGLDSRSLVMPPRSREHERGTLNHPMRASGEGTREGLSSRQREHTATCGPPNPCTVSSTRCEDLVKQV